MRFKDKIRFILTKMLSRETVLFSKVDDWEWPIRNKIVEYFPNEVPFFYEFNEINPDIFDLIIPLTVHAEKYINDNFAYVKDIKVLNPSNIAIDLCDDKEKFSNFMINNGFLCFIPRINGTFSYPYILKKKIGKYGKEITIINDVECEIAHIDEIESDDYFRQEYIDGTSEYTTHVIIYDKKIVFFKTLEFTFNDRYFVKGINFKHESQAEVDHSHYKHLFENILSKLEYQGICCFNYKLYNNEVKIFEINPRYGSTMTCFLNEALVCYRNILKMTNRV